MKVIFDISTVSYNPSQRTGLARVSWALAQLLHERLDSDISFSAIGSLSASLQVEKLLHDYPKLISAIRPVHDFVKQIEIQYVSSINKSNPNFTEFFLQNFWKSVSRLINISRNPIKPEFLNQSESIFHSSYARIPSIIRKNFKNRHIQTVHDLTPLVLGDTYFSKDQQSITKRLIDTIQPNDWITTVSNSTRNDLINRKILDPEKVITIYNAASPDIFYPVSDGDLISQAKSKYNITFPNYFLTLHSLAPHKNTVYLIQIFQDFLHETKAKDICLIIAGGSDLSIQKFIYQNRLSNNALKQVQFVGFVMDSDLAALYSGSIGFLFPSMYEGFGLPVLEAMQCGCPVIASKVSSLPEIVGDAGLLIPARDQDALGQGLLDLYHSSTLRLEYQSKSLKQASLFSWNKSINQLLKVYQKVCSNN